MKQALRKNLVLLVIALVSTIGLCALSCLTILDYTYENEERYIISCNEGIIEELETSLRYGKSLESYYGIETVLSKEAELLEDAVLLIEDADGEMLASSSQETILFSDWKTVVQEIRGEDGQTAGKLYTYYPRKPVLDSLRKDFIVSLAASLLCWLLLAAACMLLGFKGWPVARLIHVVVIFIVAQGIFLTVLFQPRFREAAEKNALSVASYVSSSMDSLLDKGVSLEEISDLEEYLEQKASDNPSIREIAILPSGEAVEADHYYSFDLEGSGKKMVIFFMVDEQNIRQNVINMALTFIATIILVLIVMRESLTISEMAEFRRSGQFGTRSRESFQSLAKAIRYGNFLSVTFDYMCLSFSAMLIRQWNQGIWGSSASFAAALSISICSAADILGMLCMPYLGRKIRTKHIMGISAVLLLVCNAACFFTASTLVVVVMRFFSGLATAGIKQVRNTVISQGCTNEEQRNANLTASNNGVIGGILCGMGLGSVLAGVFGYGATFLAAAIGNGLYLIFESRFLPWELLEGNQVSHAERKGNLAVRVGGVMKNPSVWLVTLLVSVPQYFMLMVIVCLIPAHIQVTQMPGVVLTYSNLINGLAGLYLGEKLFSGLQKKFRLPTIMSFMLFTGAVAMAIMQIPFGGVVFVLISAALMGFVDGIGTPVATDLFMENGTIVSRLDDTESLMLYSLIGSAVMTAAPFILESCAYHAVWLLAVCGVLMAMGVYVRWSYSRKQA